MNLLVLLVAAVVAAFKQKRDSILVEQDYPSAVFTAPASWQTGVEQLPNIYNSSALNANEVGNGYRVVNLTSTSTGLQAILKLRGKASNIYGYDYDLLNFTVTYQSQQRLNVRVQPLNMSSDVFILPDFIVPRPEVEGPLDIGNSDLLFEYTSDDFGFAIVRKSTGEALFDTRGNPLVFENQFVQFNTSLPKGHVLSGLGEAFGSYELYAGTNRTIKTNDNGNPFGKDLYGNYPMYYDQRYDTNTTHAVWWRTSAIQEIIIEETSLTWRALSGVIDLFFFAGPTPSDAIKQYVQAIGLSAMQQYWTLGYHQCRWGYKDLDEMKSVVQGFKDANIPVETFWNDLDYMDRYLDFTFSPKFPAPAMKNFLDDLHDEGMHYVPLLDAGIYVPGKNTSFYPDYTAYVEGHDMDIFIKNPDGSEYIGMVWPGFTVWPDFFNNHTQGYWTEQISDWRSKLDFDGLWTDMNEPSSFIAGSKNRSILDNITGPVNPAFSWGAPTTNYPHGYNISNNTNGTAVTYTDTTSPYLTPLNTTWQLAGNYKLPGKGNIAHPPYAIDYYNGDYDLAVHHLSPLAVHSNGFVEYDLEGLFGHMETNATYHALLESKPNKRPFIISRSTFTGSGNWTGHWGGDNVADWPWARASIAQYFQVASSGGIPFFGVDACGFSGNTDAELCSRWMQLASFFPFFRNHNALGSIPQEPYRWEEVASATRISMDIRYSLLPYYYTLLYEAHTSGMPVLRQFKWLFPNDRSLANIEDQFFVGNSLLVTPVLAPNASTVTGVFPGSGATEIYYDWYTHEARNFSSKRNNTLRAPLGHIPLHVRGGAILPTQQPNNTIRDSRKNPFGLIVALDKDGRASGELYLDDGESVDVEESLSVNFFAADQQLTSIPVGKYKAPQKLANITIMGVAQKPQQVVFGNVTTKFDYVNRTLFINNLQDVTPNGAWSKQFSVTWN